MYKAATASPHRARGFILSRPNSIAVRLRADRAVLIPADVSGSTAHRFPARLLYPALEAVHPQRSYLRPPRCTRTYM